MSPPRSEPAGEGARAGAGRAPWATLGRCDWDISTWGPLFPFQDGFSGPLGPQEKDFPPRFHGVLSPGVLAPPRAGFGTSKGSGAGEGGVPELCRDFRG